MRLKFNNNLLLPMNLILVFFFGFWIGNIVNLANKRTLELDSTTRIVVMKGDTQEKTFSIPDGMGEGRFVFILGKSKAFIYDTTAEYLGCYTKELIQSPSGDTILGKEHLRIVRQHFKGEY